VTAVPTPHGQPRYRAIAEELRKRIQDGAIPPGALLPPESALIREFAVSRGTIREAIATLRTNGLVTTEQGRGTYVRQQLRVSRLRNNRYRRIQSTQSTSPAMAEADMFDGAEVSYREIAADRHLAGLFQTPEGTTLLEYRRVQRIDGIPHQLSTSFYKHEIGLDLRAVEPSHMQTGNDPVARLDQVGIAVTRILEYVRARLPKSDELTALRITEGTPVMTIHRHTYSFETVVEVACDVLPADRNEVEFEFDLSPPPHATK
jgi:GntR family transcriptional regulator